jgi:pimeloyl-ACP methyl ester carboxylesterase
MTQQIRAGVLNVAFESFGERSGWPVVLTHGFPYDPSAYQQVAPLLAKQGAYVVTPYMRGYGPTAFLQPTTLRSGQQAAFGQDLRDLILALGLERPIVGGYDWGGRASCVCSALWPDLVSGLVSVNGYNLQDIAKAMQPASPDQERRIWYQYYFHSERGRAGLEQDRAAFCRLLWQLWSPTWQFEEVTYRQSAKSFENPDFVDVVIHSYRHRFGLVPGDPSLESLEEALALQPRIAVAAITLDGRDDGIWHPKPAEQHAQGFSGFHQHRFVDGAGHNLPQEAPDQFAQAVFDLHQLRS